MINRIRSFITVLRGSRHPLRMILGQVLVKTGLNRFFTIDMGAYKLKFSRSALAVTLFADKHERHEDEDIITSCLQPGNTYVDVGANIGTLVLTAAKAVTPSGKVVAIEAHPSTFDNLQQNIRINSFTNIQAIHSAAGSEPGSLFFSNMNSDDQNKVITAGNGIRVNVNKLDSLLKELMSIDLLKVDVEGYEKFVFEGATETLVKTRAVLYESWEKHFQGFGYSTGKVIALLQTNGFRVFKPSKGNLVPVNENYTSGNCENLLALKDASAFSRSHGYTISP